MAAALLGGLAASASADVRWALDFQPGLAGTVTAKGVEGPGTYLFLTFTVTNPTDQDVPLRLSIDVETDVKGRTYHNGFDPVVTKLVRARHGKELKTLSEARGTLASGESVSVVATLGKLDPNCDSLVFQVHGLRDRVYADQYKTWVEDNVLNLSYARPGDEFYRQHDLLRFVASKWGRLAPRKEIARN